METESLIVVYDACVLYSAPLRDFLMRLALTGLFQAKWTDQIHEEWITNLLRNRPDISRVQLEKTRQSMDRAVLDCLVEGYESLIDELDLPDINDRHVLAAAIKSKASRIITFNLRDFPEEQLLSYCIRAQHPDDFILGLISRDTDLVFQVFQRQQESLRRPPTSPEELLVIFNDQGLTKSVAVLRTLLLERRNP